MEMQTPEDYQLQHFVTYKQFAGVLISAVHSSMILSESYEFWEKDHLPNPKSRWYRWTNRSFRKQWVRVGIVEDDYVFEDERCAADPELGHCGGDRQKERGARGR